MNLRLHACLWLGLFVSGCDKPTQTGSPAEKNPAGPRVTKTARPPREHAPDVRKKLRAEFANAAAIESTPERDAAMAGIAWDAIELEPELAREAMEKLSPDGEERIRLIQHVAMRMAEENVDEALKWAASLGTENESAAAFGHIALVISDTDPVRAANLLSESGIAGRAFDVVAVQVLGRWAEQSPENAAAWAALFPPGASRDAGIKSVVSTWLETDAAAAFSWMATIRDEAVRKETAAAMAAALRQQPESVREEWLGQADGEIRAELEAAWAEEKKETGNDSRPPSDGEQ